MAKGIAFFRKAVETLDPNAQKSVGELSEKHVLLVPNVMQDELNQEEVEETIRDRVVDFVSERLRSIGPRSNQDIKLRQTTFEEIIEKTGECYRE